MSSESSNNPLTTGEERDLFAASQIEAPPSMPGQTPPSTANATEPLFSSSLPQGIPLASSQMDIPATVRRGRIRTELGDLQMSQLLSDNEGGLGLQSERSGLGAPQSDAAMRGEHAGEASPTERIRVIWGTNIVISDAISAFRSFLANFAPAQRKRFEAAAVPNGPLPEMLASDLDPLYPRLLAQIRDTEIYNLNLDCENLRAFPATVALHQQLLHYPQEIISLMDMLVNDLFGELFPDTSIAADPIQVRPFNIGHSVNMRALDPSDIDKLISIKGLIIRVSSIVPDMRVAYFVCGQCSQPHTVENVKGRIAEPRRCPREECAARDSMVLVHNRCLFSDKQVVKIQETPDAIPDGQTPHAVTLCVYDALVDVARPGDRVEVTGIFRSAPVRASQHQRRLQALFRTYVDVVHLRRTDAERWREAVDTEALLTGAFDESDRVQAEERARTAELRALAQHPRLYEALAHSIAPGVWGLGDVKKGLLLQLFGGVGKSLKRASTARFRGDVNILLAGDPGVSKSQLLQYVHKLAPRGIYTSGKGSSAVGLTAYITRDAESNQLVLESGALVLSDGGICCIDEFDKMSDETRAILHEVMEQQTVSIAKAGIITTLNARTSILASANPVESKYNPARSIVENLNLPPTLLSRFDIIYLLLDSINVEDDQRLGRHIVGLYAESSGGAACPANEAIDTRLLARYISYARGTQPVLSEPAIQALTEGYVAMRKVNGASGKTVSATTRQLESLIRLSEAHAKMRLSDEVALEDVQEAIRLVREAMLSNAVDPLTGKIDMDLINTGKSSALRERQADLKRQIKALLAARPSPSLDFGTLHAEMSAQSSIPVNDKWLRDVLEELVEEEFIRVTGNVRRGHCLLYRL